MSSQEIGQYWTTVNTKENVLQFKLKLKERRRPTMAAAPSAGMLPQIPEDPSEGRATEVGKVPDKIDVQQEVFQSMAPVTAREQPSPEPVVQTIPEPAPEDTSEQENLQNQLQQLLADNAKLQAQISQQNRLEDHRDVSSRKGSYLGTS